MKGLILIYVITAIATMVALRRPKIGLYVYVGFAVLRPQFIWGWAGDLENLSLIVGLAMLIGWALQGFGSWRIGRGRPVVWALLGYTVWYAISGLQAQDTTRSFGALVELAKIVLPFLVGITTMEGEQDWRAMLWTIALAQGYVSLEMNMNYVFKGYNSAALGFGGMDNNCFGVSLVATLGLSIALGLSSKRWYQRGLAAASAALILHTILLTFSRGALIGLLAVGLAAVLILPKRPRYLIPIVVVALLAFRLTGDQLAARYSTAFSEADDRDASSQSRVDLWRDCLKVIATYPLFGVGPWNWPVVAASYGWPAGKSAHSVWMETAAETGVPGSLMLMLFFGVGAAKLWPIARARPTPENRHQIVLATGIVLSIVGFAVSGQFVSVTGLEAPYYSVMAAVVMLKTVRPEQDATVPALARPLVPLRVAPRPAAVRNSVRSRRDYGAPIVTNVD